MAQFKPQIFQTKSGKLLKIRNFEISDLEAIQSFFKKGAEETNHTLRCKEKPTPDDKLKERIEGALSSSSEFYVGVFDSEAIVGSLQFRTAIPDHPWVKHIGEFGMLILKDYWGQGIGKELLRIMEEFASQIGITRIEAKVGCNNERGIALYQRNGFKIEGIREEGAFINGKFVNEYFIAKILRSSPKESGLRKILFQDERHSLSIKPLEESDAADIHAAVMITLPNLLSFLDWAHRTLSVEGQIDRIRKSQEKHIQGTEYHFSVRDQNSGEFLMSASLHPPRALNKKSFGVGYWTTRSHCNKGFATLVTKILTRFAFDVLGCDRVEIACNKNNQPSRRVIEKCGFIFEGEMRNYFTAPTATMIDNGYSAERTCLIFSLLRHDVEKLSWYQDLGDKIKVVSI